MLIIYSKITAQSLNGVNIHIHTHTSSCLLESEDNRHTYVQTPLYTLELACTNTHTSRGAPLLNTSRSVFFTYTHKYLSTGDLVDDDRHTHTHTHTHTLIRLIAQTHKHLVVHFSFILTGAFPLHACSVTRNLYTYLTSMGRVF